MINWHIPADVAAYSMLLLARRIQMGGFAAYDSFDFSGAFHSS